jgi:hypothetical protein
LAVAWCKREEDIGRAGAGNCEILGGNSDDYQKKGLDKIWIRKLLRIKEIKIDDASRRAWVVRKRKEEPGTRSVEP